MFSDSKSDHPQEELLPAFLHEQDTIRKKYLKVAGAADAVVHIAGYEGRRPIGYGSGAVVKNRYILTCRHVIEGTTDLWCYMNANGKNFMAYVDTKEAIVLPPKGNLTGEQEFIRDLALLPLPGAFKRHKIPSLNFRDDTGYDQENFLIGFAAIKKSIDWPEFGRFPTIHRLLDTYQTNSILMTGKFDTEFVEDVHGASGGAFVDRDGNLIGVLAKGIGKSDTTIWRKPFVWGIPTHAIKSAFPHRL